MSYSCLPNLERIIAGHNKRILAAKQNINAAEQSTCNCRPGNQCPLNDNCLKASIVYKAEVKLNKNNEEQGNQQQQEVRSKVYLGTAANTFKERFRNHKLSFTNDRYKNNTSLSKYIWKLKEDQVPFQVHWSAVGKAPTYTPSTNICHLCNLEKTLILLSEEETSLKKRSE